jgi:hypothetical protein
MGVCRLRTADLDDRRHDDAPLAPAAQDLVLATHLVVTHSNGISTLHLQAKLGIGSYKTA